VNCWVIDQSNQPKQLMSCPYLSIGRQQKLAIRT
jgi:hypothetical protein